MSEIPNVTFQILGPAEGSHHGLWFKIRSVPLPTEDLGVGLRVRSSMGDVKQSGVLMILKHESYSADFFYKTVQGGTDTVMEIESFASLANLALPTVTNEGYVIEAGHVFPEYSVGNLSRVMPYQWKGSE